jgi:Domain of unknown function (DUF4157)
LTRVDVKKMSTRTEVQKTADSEAIHVSTAARGGPAQRQVAEASGQFSSLQSVRETLRSPAQPLDAELRSALQSCFGHDFGRVRVHSDAQANESAKKLSAAAYTVGRDIVFGPDQYAPRTLKGFDLLAHELSHTIQQGQQELREDEAIRVGESNSVHEREADQAAPTIVQGYSPYHVSEQGGLQLQRKAVTEEKADLTTRTPSEIMADEAYVDNHLKSIQFYSAELAILHYDDGSKLRLGLVPQYIQPPVEGVDYRTGRASHIPIVPTQPGKLQYFPRGKETIERVDDKSTITIGELLKEFTRTVTFKRDGVSNKIVPTQINSITAPRLCAVLRDAEAEYVKNFDALAQGGKKVFESLKTTVELASLLPAGGGAAEAVEARAAARAASAVSAGAEATLTKKFMELLAKRTAGEITVEGVAFGDIEVALEGTELMIRRSAVANVSRLPNQGKIMQAVWEGAAVAAARQAGAKTVQIALRTIQNQTWAAYLESQGYVWEVVPKLFGQAGIEKALVKIITL